jgi:hypothetical protein
MIDGDFVDDGALRKYSRHALAPINLSVMRTL